MSEREWWEPELCDAAYFARLRADYPEHADWSDEELHEYFNDGLKYDRTWDHIGDAYEEYEPLADAYLSLRATNARLVDALEEAARVLDRAWAAIWDKHYGRGLSLAYARERGRECSETRDAATALLARLRGEGEG